jgi:O-antigen/teichoic acid export membrane protein
VSAVVSVVAIVSVTRGEAKPHQAPPRFGFPAHGYGKLVKAGIPLAAAQFLISLTTYVPVLLVELLGSSADVGVYTVASYLVVFANLIWVSVATVVLPAFVLTLNQMGIVRLLRRAARLGLFAIAPAVVVIPSVVFFGTFVLEFIYGPGYALTSLELSLLAITSVLAVPSALYSSVLLALNSYRSVTIASAIAALTVMVSGGVFLAGGLAAVTAGCLALFVGSLARCGGLFAFAHLKKHAVEK